MTSTRTGLPIVNVAALQFDLPQFGLKPFISPTGQQDPASMQYSGKNGTRRKFMLLAFLVLFLLPIATRAALFAFEDRPRSWREADWSSTGSLPPATSHPEARLLIMSGRSGGLK